MGSKKLSGSTKGYLILLGLVVLSWGIFKVLSPHNFGSAANMLNYFQASLILFCNGNGYVRLLYRSEHHAFRYCGMRICDKV